MTHYKEIKRELMKEFKINSVALTDDDLIAASNEANMNFTSGCVLAISTAAVRLYRIYLFSDEVGNCYYVAFGDCLPEATENDTPISFHFKENEVWWGRTYKIKHLKYQNAVEKKISEILYGVSHLGH
jgi:hypothetical protein